MPQTKLLRPDHCAGQADVTPSTVNNWCRDYGIGVKIGKQWRVRPELWERVMSGETLANISQR
jgi:hypothetical protein